MLIYPLFFFMATLPSAIYTLSLHDALPILMAPTTLDRIDPPRIPTLAESSKVVSPKASVAMNSDIVNPMPPSQAHPCNAIRSEEHTSELQSHSDLVCRLLLEKKNSILICR